MNAQPAILSIAVLASLALAIGGGWLMARRRDRKRGVLMIVMALVLLANVLLWALPVGARTIEPRYHHEPSSQRRLGSLSPPISAAFANESHGSQPTLG